MCGSTGKASADQQPRNGLLVSLKKKQTHFFIGLVPGELGNDVEGNWKTADLKLSLRVHFLIRSKLCL